MALYALFMFESDHMCMVFCQIPPDPYSNEVTAAECQEVDTMCISPAEETLAISTDQGQLYSVSLASVEVHKVVQSPLPAPLLTVFKSV